jgi:hypothetical protein
MVCQQWLSEVGLVLEVVGFLTIAMEWHHEFVRDRRKTLNELQAAYTRAALEARGEPVPDQYEDRMMWHAFQKLYLAEWKSKWRGRVFYTAVTLVVLGFVGQFTGSWPGGLPLLGAKAC